MGTGGSRYGAGRPGWRRKCEHLLSLDVRQLHRRRLLRPGSSFGWYWSRGGEPSGNVSVRIDHEGLTLDYQWTPSSREPVGRRTTFLISQTNCHFGGIRNWLRCKWCGRRCAVIYGVSGDGYFACRRCLKLGYSGESEDLLGRLWRKQHKLEARLGEDCQKPKWMRMRTYERIWTQINEVEEMKDHAFCLGAMAILRRGGISIDDLN
jgi:hypothetical protein